MSRFLFCAVLIMSLTHAADDPRALIASVGFDQKLNQPIPQDLSFTDETGQPVQLKKYFGGKPILLTLVYHDCPMLCSAELTGLVTCMRAMPYTLGKDFDILTVSFNPKDSTKTSALKKMEYLRSYGRPGGDNAWHFLTGPEESIQALTKAVGFRYNYDKTTGQFAHASGIVLLTPDGKVSRYFFGVEYFPRDLDLGIVEASQNKIGSFTDQVLLYCYRYDPMTGRYGVTILSILRIAAVLTVLALGTFMVLMFRRDSRQVAPGRAG